MSADQIRIFNGALTKTEIHLLEDSEDFWMDPFDEIRSLREEVLLADKRLARRKELSLESIFILVDASDIYEDDKYYPLAAFLTLDDAKQALANGPDIGWLRMHILDHKGDMKIEDIFTVEIWERTIGFSGQGQQVFIASWEKEYNEDKDEYFWSQMHVHDAF